MSSRVFDASRSVSFGWSLRSGVELLIDKGFVESRSSIIVTQTGILDSDEFGFPEPPGEMAEALLELIEGKGSRIALP